MTFQRTTLKVAIAALTGSMLTPMGTAFAQNELALEEIIVTARKREESLQDIPIALNAFTADDILEGGIVGLEDISSLSSGFYFFNQGQSQPGRYNTQLRFRGINQQQFSPSFETGALFIDGVYVLNGGTSLSLMDIERVEVIKGPQAAYFGRGTASGAVNFITKNPSMEEFSGIADVRVGNRDLVDAQAYIEGPLIADKLSGSVGIRLYDKEGHYTASDGGRLGNEETKTINGKLFFQATDNLSFSFRAAYSEDDDGAPAQAYIPGQNAGNDSCTGLTVTTGAGETAFPTRYICGQVPGPGDNPFPAVNSVLIDGNTIIPPQTFDDLTTGPRPNGAPFIDRIGLKRETTRISGRMNYDWDNDYSLTATLGFNDQAANWIRDFDLSGLSNAYSNDPQGLEDQSFELRITSPQDGRLRWAAGINLYEQEFTSSGAGGNFVFACLGDTGAPVDPCAVVTSLNFGNSLQNADESTVEAIFGSVDFDINDYWTLTFEGRYQSDELVKGGVVDEGGLVDGARTLETTDFLPRIIARWTPTENTMFYASYAEGLVNGDVNQQFLNADARERPQYLATFPNLGESTPTETLETIELGFKTNFWDGRAYFNGSIYMTDWTGIKGRSSVAVNETCDASGPNALGAPGCMYDGVMVGDPKLTPDPFTGELVEFFNARNVLIAGDGEVKGFELEIGGQMAAGWTVDASIGWTEPKYTDYQFNFVQRIAGFSDMTGNSTPRTPEWSGNLTSSYSFPIRGGDMEGYVRGDLSYMGEVFTDETNLAFLEDYFLLNLRAGIDMNDGAQRIELFVNNALDEDAWLTGARFSDTAFPVDFGNFFVQQGFNVTPQNKRELGVRAVIRF